MIELRSSTKVKVILPAALIPNGSTITKCGGTYRFKIFNSFRIHSEGVEQPGPITQKLELHDQTRVIVSEVPNSNINVVAGTTEYTWHTTVEELHAYLESKLDEEDNK